jgi:predicted metal-dependent hydrolase
MKETFTINDLEFELRHSNRRKTVGITVDRQGELVVSAPTSCPIELIRGFVEEKRLWIYTKLAEKEMLLPPRSKKEFVTGEGFPYLGRQYRLKLVDAERGQPPLRLYQGRYFLDRKRKDEGRKHFIRWYTAHAIPWLDRRVDLFKDRVGVVHTGLKVRDLGSRWGSCNAAGTLNLHWRTILLPPRIIEYVIMHELVHLAEPHHTPEFWRRMERAMPDFAARKKWLAENGVKADI